MTPLWYSGSQFRFPIDSDIGHYTKIHFRGHVIIGYNSSKQEILVLEGILTVEYTDSQGASCALEGEIWKDSLKTRELVKDLIWRKFSRQIENAINDRLRDKEII